MNVISYHEEMVKIDVDVIKVVLNKDIDYTNIIDLRI